MIRPTSQLIFSLFLDQFEDFLPTYNANGEIEVRRNTLPRLVHVTVLLQISLHYVRFHTRFALPMSMAAPLWRLVCQTKSNRIQAVAQELVKISLFYIYMNRYLHISL